MINRQRIRAQNIIRCHKNVEILYMVKSEKAKIDIILIEIGFTSNPEFISYNNGQLHVVNGITKNQAIKIELDFLMSAIQNVQISFKEYHNQLNNILSQINVINANNKI